MEDAATRTRGQEGLPCGSVGCVPHATTGGMRRARPAANIPHMAKRNYSVRMGDVIVGRSALDEEGTVAGTLRGVFRAGFGWQLVEPVFDLRPAAGAEGGAALERYTRARDALKLRLVDERGATVPTRRLDIVRSGTAHAPGTLMLEVELE